MPSAALLGAAAAARGVGDPDPPPVTNWPPMLTHLPYSNDTGLNMGQGATPDAVLAYRIARGDTTGFAWYGGGGALDHSAYWADKYSTYAATPLHSLAMPNIYNQAKLINWATNMPVLWRPLAEYSAQQEPEDNIVKGTLVLADYLLWVKNAGADLAPFGIANVQELQGYWLISGASHYDVVVSCVSPFSTRIDWSQIVQTGWKSNVGNQYAVAMQNFHAGPGTGKEMRLGSISYGVPDGTPAVSSIRQSRANNLEIALNRAIDVGCKGIGYYDLRFLWSDGLWYDFRLDDYSVPVMIAARERLASLT